MTIKILLPTGDSYATLSVVGASPHYAAVRDNNSSRYVHGASDAGYTADVYWFPAPQSAGTINSISLQCVVIATTANHHVKMSMSAGMYYAAEHTIPRDSSPHTYTDSWTINPDTGLAWTWADIANDFYGQCGIAADHSTVNIFYFAYIIDYTPSTPATIYLRASGIPIRDQYLLTSGQIFANHGYFMRSSHNLDQMVVGSTGSKVTGPGAIDGMFAGGLSPLISLAGTCEVSGSSSTTPLYIRNNLYHGIQCDAPASCIFQDLVIEDCRSGTSTVPVIGDASLGMGLWLNGAGTGNILRRLNVKRCGIHGIQVYGSNNNLLDYINVDGVYGYFGLSLYQTDGTTAQNVTTANTRREGINAMECDYTMLTDVESHDAQTDYGICVYMCNHGTITRPVVYRSWKDGISLEGASNFAVTDGELVDVGRGNYVGHHSGIILQGSTGYDCLSNSISGCTITDKHHYLIYPIKEAINTDDIGSNTITNNSGYGTRRKVVRLVGTGSTESGNVWR